MKRFLLLILLASLWLPGKVYAQVSGAGQLGCPGSPVTGTAWNSGTALNSTQPLLTNTSALAAMVELDQTTTLTAGAVTFNLSGDGSAGSYFAAPVAQILNPSTGAQLTNPYTLVASTNQQFIVLLNGSSNLQLKLTTAITGSGSVTPFVTSLCFLPSWPLPLDSAGNGLVDLNKVGGSSIALGQTTMASSLPVVIASNQSTLNTSDTQSGNWTVRTVGNSGGVFDAAGQNASSPANEILIAGQFNTTPTTITSGNVSPFQLDSSGKLLVNPGTVSITANSSVNVNQILGNAVSTAATGVQKVGIVGNAGGVFDQAPGSAVPANAIMEGLSDGINTRFALADTSGRQLVKQYPDTTTTSYRASVQGLASAASATDIAVLPGNNTNTVLVNRVEVSCNQTTAGSITLQLIKRSTADTAGTHANMTVMPDDSNFAAGVSVPLSYTANPTTGTAVATVHPMFVSCLASGTAGAQDVYIERFTKPIILRGTAQQLAVNLNGATVTGGSFDVTFEYDETTTP